MSEAPVVRASHSEKAETVGAVHERFMSAQNGDGDRVSRADGGSDDPPAP